jgi:hypothetical protein
MIEHPPNDSDKCIYKDEETGETVYCLDSLKVNVKDFVALLNAFDNAVYVLFRSFLIYIWAERNRAEPTSVPRHP